MTNVHPINSTVRIGALNASISITVPLVTPGHHVIIDAADYDLVSQFRWYACNSHNHTYARSWRDGELLLLHRLLLDAPDHMQVDHINRVGLDNRRCNLRLATASQNQANRRKKITSSSHFKGVTWLKNAKKWRAAIGDGVSGKKRYLGYFNSPVDAARAYNAAAVERWGDFALINDIPTTVEVAA